MENQLLVPDGHFAQVGQGDERGRPAVRVGAALQMERER